MGIDESEKERGMKIKGKQKRKRREKILKKKECGMGIKKNG